MGNKEIAFWIVLMIISVASIMQIYVLYANADTVECDGIWCKFTTVRQEAIMECFENGKRINCSESIDMNEIMDEVMTLREEPIS